MTNHDFVRTFDKVVLNLFNLIVLGGLPLFAIGMVVQPFAR